MSFFDDLFRPLSSWRRACLCAIVACSLVACADDGDEDDVPDEEDNCLSVSNPDQADTDGDGVGDACDICPNVADPDQENSDGDSLGDACDNCPQVDNESQTNSDGDSLGDACDNCMTVDNEDQANADGDSHGDVCDNCMMVDNEDQANDDSDSLGNACDNCPTADNEDQVNSDGDSLGDACDNCPTMDNENQADTDLFDEDENQGMFPDGVGDVCDNCLQLANPTQSDINEDGFGDACDSCFPGGAVTYPDEVYTKQLKDALSDEFYVDLEVGDFDQDGYDDFVVLDNRSTLNEINVHRSNPSGTGEQRFAARYMFVTGTGGIEMAVLDANADSYPDVVTLNLNDLTLFLNAEDNGKRALFDGGANYQILSINGMTPYDLITGDFDGDGADDIVVAGIDANGPALAAFFGDGSSGLHTASSGNIEAVSLDTGRLSPSDGWVDVFSDGPSKIIAKGDFDENPGEDVALLTKTGKILIVNQIRKTLNSGGNITSATNDQAAVIELPSGADKAQYRHLAAASIEQNGLYDLFVYAPAGSIGGGNPDLRVLRNDGMASFEVYWSGLPPSGKMLYAGDLGYNGYADIFLGDVFLKHSPRGQEPPYLNASLPRSYRFELGATGAGDVSATDLVMGNFSDDKVPEIVVVGTAPVGANVSGQGGALSVLAPACE